MHFHKLKTLPILISMSLIAAACGISSTQTESEIATAVMQTVQAQASLTEVSTLPTPTVESPSQAIPTFPEPPTPDALLPTATPAPLTSNPGCVVSANLVSESPPDDTLLLPGEYFWKTWVLANTGSCIWDKSYSLIFWDGVRMGGLDSYPLNDIIEPGENLEISIYLQAPAAEGTATGYWRLRTPWGVDFGAGPLSASFYVQISVAEKPKYGITKVEYQLVRDPAEGCPANVRYTVYATITSNGPVDIEYYWDQSDGNESGIRTLEFTTAGSLTVQREWMLGRGATQNPRWMQLIVTAPQYREYDKVTFVNNCP
jgi:hypothetical protein